MKETADALSKARKFITEVSSKEKFITDTFRIGFVGKSISDQFGTEYIQTSRGRPYGTLAAVYDEETGKHKNVELFKSTSQIQIVLFLRDLWFEMSGQEIPTDNAQWNSIKEKNNG